MAWVNRAGKRYYYRSVRKSGRVTREYHGGGAEGRLAAALDQARQRRRAGDREQLRRLRDTWAAACAPLEELAALADLVVRAALLGAGYHQHHQSEWRRRRDGSH